MRRSSCHVELRAVSPSAAVAELLRRFAAWFVAEGADYVFRSPLEDSDPNEHLKWFHAILQRDRKLIRRLQDQGLNLVIRIRVTDLPIRLAPEALLLAHQLRLPMELHGEASFA